MKILAINGSPRKSWNTATLLKKALEGAAAEGAETELVHLYDLDFKGCISCFACKLKGGKSYGKCAVRDELTPILEEIPKLDGIILGSPNFLGDVTGEMRSFMERMTYPYIVYDKNRSILFPKKLKNAWIFTMNIPETRLKESGYEHAIRSNEMLMARVFGSSESLIVTDTYQFDDYSKYISSMNDPELKAKRRLEVFPIDCRRAFELGSRMAIAAALPPVSKR
jgi:multimeric flavodoxin WrbA